MKKILSALFIVLIALSLFACTGDNFNDMVIDAGDVSDVPEGEYTLVYSIKNYEKYKEKYPDMEIFVTVVDDRNETVSVLNNRTLTILKDRVYTVRIAVYATVGDERQQVVKMFTVSAAKSDPVVFLHVGNNDNWWSYADLKYGDSLDISLIPEVPDYRPNNDGYDREILAKRWVVGKKDSDTLLTQDALNNIKRNVHIYAQYDYKLTPKNYSIVFHNNGGSETETITRPYLSTISPPEFPTKADCVFDGWYTEEGLVNKFSWQRHASITDNFHLYAKWLPSTDESVNALYDYEVKNTSDGYSYALAKPKSNMAGAVTLPNNYGNIPVKGFQNNAFLNNTGITSVVIPAQYDNNTYRAFEGCTSLSTVVFEEGSKTYFLSEGTFRGCTSLSNIVLPSGIKNIGIACFENCTSLNGLVLPNIDKITTACFAGSGLTSVTVPDSVTRIIDSAFKGCVALTQVNISASSSLTSIDDNVFDDTAVTDVTLPYYFYKNNIYPFADKPIAVHYHPELQS